MPSKSTPNQIRKLSLHALPVEDNSSIQAEYQGQQALYAAQPTLIKRFVELQAQKLVEAIRKNQIQASFSLPDKVALEENAEGAAVLAAVPPELREQLVGGVINRLTRADLRSALRQRLGELEGSAEAAVAVSARLLRHALALHLVYNLLPSGRSVVYLAGEGEEIPTIPTDLGETMTPDSAITQASDAIAEEKPDEAGRGELQVPFVPVARRFYLPQWVAFDEKGKLLGSSISEAESHLAAMQSFLGILHSAVSLAPYMIADPLYQQKRYGMLGQLINQGRALARYENGEMVRVIKQRSAANDLNRGLSLSMPYFDDQALEIRTHDFEVIPAGRIMFVPAFVVRAAREEQAKVAQDTRLSPSTRKYLVQELKALEAAFEHK
jgi:hypothetical protein